VDNGTSGTAVTTVTNEVIGVGLGVKKVMYVVTIAGVGPGTLKMVVITEVTRGVFGRGLLG
jgi:hypothetical protein